MITVEPRRHELKLIAISFCVIVAVGSLSVFAFWWSQDAIRTGVTRVALYISIMAMVHGVGAALYITQHENPNELKREPDKWSLHESLWLALMQYWFFMIITALTLDGGYIFRCFTIALLAHGFVVGIITWRRPQTLTSIDLGLIRYGYLPIALIVSRMVAFMHQWNGASTW